MEAREAGVCRLLCQSPQGACREGVPQTSVDGCMRDWKLVGNGRARNGLHSEEEEFGAGGGRLARYDIKTLQN